MKLTINTTEIEELVEAGGKISLSAQAEVSLVTLLEMQRRIDTAVEDAKKVINERASEIDPAWSVIKSDQIKVTRSATGPRYAITDPKTLPSEFLKEKVVTSLNIDRVDEYIETTDKLPVGVGIRERGFSVNIKEIDNV